MWINMSARTIVSSVLVLAVFVGTDGAIDRPRGVQPARASHYQPGPGNTFTCISSGDKISFEFVNDDYCDCADGSDEPGTAACPGMTFFCPNKGHKSENILSSRVDDGICDCCDGSDEYTREKIQCENTCNEQGKKRREFLEKEKELREAGYNIKKQYMEQGVQAKKDNEVLIEELEVSKESLSSTRQDLEDKKTEAEEPEKEARSKHEKAWEDVKAEKQAAKEKVKAREAFTQMDANNDGFIVPMELMSHAEFDIDSDGTVSEEEAKEYLEELEHAAEDDFLEKIWPNIKEIYKSPPPPEENQPKGDDDTSPPTVNDGATEAPGYVPDQIPPPLEDITEGGLPAGIEDDEDRDDEDADDDHDDGINIPTDEIKDTEDEDKMPEYDEDTQKLIDVADEARRQFEEADQKVKEVDQKITTAKKYLENDFGPEFEYAFLHGRCFEYTDREYTYKLCAFDKATQRPKSGGSETSLGLWGHWDGPQDDKYAAQKYEKGQNCWNGPDRSVRVILQCGTENEVLSASEPSRCEYQFEFSTPAKCTEPHPDDYRSQEHDEL